MCFLQFLGFILNFIMANLARGVLNYRNIAMAYVW